MGCDCADRRDRAARARARRSRRARSRRAGPRSTRASARCRASTPDSDLVARQRRRGRLGGRRPAVARRAAGRARRPRAPRRTLRPHHPPRPRRRRLRPLVRGPRRPRAPPVAGRLAARGAPSTWTTPRAACGSSGRGDRPRRHRQGLVRRARPRGDARRVAARCPAGWSTSVATSRCGAAPPEGGPWRIAVADPRTPGGTLATLLVVGGGVATSGRDRRRFGPGGALHHLIDPSTGAPARGGPLAVTVAGRGRGGGRGSRERSSPSAAGGGRGGTSPHAPTSRRSSCRTTGAPTALGTLPPRGAPQGRASRWPERERPRRGPGRLARRARGRSRRLRPPDALGLAGPRDEHPPARHRGVRSPPARLHRTLAWMGLVGAGAPRRRAPAGSR